MRESCVLHLPVAKEDTDWNTSERMDQVRAVPSFGANHAARYDSVSMRGGEDGEIWFCKVHIDM